MNITPEVQARAAELIVERTDGGYTQPGAERLVNTTVLVLQAIHDAIEELQVDVFA
jgi:hypothetical protein